MELSVVLLSRKFTAKAVLAEESPPPEEERASTNDLSWSLILIGCSFDGCASLARTITVDVPAGWKAATWANLKPAETRAIW